MWDSIYYKHFLETLLDTCSMTLVGVTNTFLKKFE